ncbi:YggT family protein [candidate division KSB1 bacterium]|nr:YggT family protein [candidate division KSB1 bacterium]
MFIIANLLITIAKIIDIAVTLYIFAIIARVIISWIQYDPYNSVVRFIVEITEPPLAKIRQLVPTFGGLDISPMILIFVLYILEGFVVSTLNDLALALK